jgi:hypothetical protein
MLSTSADSAQYFHLRNCLKRHQNGHGSVVQNQDNFVRSSASRAANAITALDLEKVCQRVTVLRAARRSGVSCGKSSESSASLRLALKRFATAGL